MSYVGLHLSFHSSLALGHVVQVFCNPGKGFCSLVLGFDNPVLGFGNPFLGFSNSGKDLCSGLRLFRRS